MHVIKINKCEHFTRIT